MQSRYAVITVSCASRREATAIARALLRARLIACAQIAPRVQSRYRWKGRVERAVETALVMKTAARLFRRIVRRVKSLHSYELPEIIMTPISAGDQPYLQWIEDSVE